MDFSLAEQSISPVSETKQAKLSTNSTKFNLPPAVEFQFISTPGFTSQIDWLNSKTGAQIVAPVSSCHLADVKIIFKCLADVLQLIGVVAITGWANGQHGAKHIAQFKMIPGARKMSPWNKLGFKEYTRAVAFAGKFAGRVDYWFNDWLNTELKLVSRCGLLRQLAESQDFSSFPLTSQFLSEVVAAFQRDEMINFSFLSEAMALNISSITSSEVKGLGLIGFVFPEEQFMIEMEQEQIDQIRRVWADWAQIFAVMSHTDWTRSDWMHWSEVEALTGFAADRSELDGLLTQGLKMQDTFLACIERYSIIKANSHALSTSVLRNVFSDEEKTDVQTKQHGTAVAIDFDAITTFSPLMLDQEDRSGLELSSKLGGSSQPHRGFPDVIILSPFSDLRILFPSGPVPEFWMGPWTGPWKGCEWDVQKPGHQGASSGSRILEILDDSPVVSTDKLDSQVVTTLIPRARTNNGRRTTGLHSEDRCKEVVIDMPMETMGLPLPLTLYMPMSMHVPMHMPKPIPTSISLPPIDGVTDQSIKQPFVPPYCTYPFLWRSSTGGWQGLGVHYSPLTYRMMALLLSQRSRSDSENRIPERRQDPNDRVPAHATLPRTRASRLSCYNGLFDWTLIRAVLSIYRFAHTWVPPVRWFGPQPITFPRSIHQSV